MAFLAAMDMPPAGGDTMWASMTAAYDALSEPMQRICEDLRGTHKISEGIVDAFRSQGDEFVQQIYDTFPPVTHPIVRTHPDTGRNALYVAKSFMTGIDGLTASESKAMTEFLLDHVANPNFQVRWNWTVGDLAIWDERCTLHRALSDHFPQNRAVRRCTINGDTPYFGHA